MDGISAAASIAALVHVGRVIYHHSYDATHDRVQRERFEEAVERLLTLLKLLETREHDARQSPTSTWYRGFLALVQSASMTPSKDGKLIPDPTGKGDGVLVRLTKDMQKMKDDLETQHGKFKRLRQRLKWSVVDKEKCQDMLDQIERWRSQVDSVLNQDHFALSLSIHNQVLNSRKITEDTNQRLKSVEILDGDTNQRLKSVEVLDGDTNQRIKSVEILDENTNKRVQGIESAVAESNNRMRAFEEKRERREREEERKAIIAWLSPFEFRRRQSEIFNQSIPTGETLLRSPVFEAWASGRPWSLFCYGMAGAGKVRYA